MFKKLIPESWTEAKIADVVLATEQTRPQGEITYIDIDAIDNSSHLITNPKYLKAKDAPSRARKTVIENDVVYSTVRPYLKNIAIVPSLPNSIASTGFCVLRAKKMVPQFIFHYVRSDLFLKKIEPLQKGASYPAVSDSIVKSQQIPIPPHAEQKRIVAKIESTQEKVKTIESNISKAEGLIEKYRESLLQKAFRGELVPQDPNDEPASKLLERIRTDRANQSIGVKKKKDELPPIKPEEIPFEIPKSWEWVRLGDIASQVQYGFTASAETKGSHRFLRITDLTKDGVQWDEVPFCNPSKEDAAKLELVNGDILFARTGGTVGKSHMITEIPEKAVFASYLIKVRTLKQFVMPAYVSLFFSSPVYWQFVKDSQKGAAQPNINGTVLSELLIPIPPRFEQNRIVDRFNSVFRLVNNLKDQTLQVKSQIKGLCDSTLEAAFRGNLVPQDPMEGTGHELLATIQSEQSRGSEQPSPRVRNTEKNPSLAGKRKRAKK